MPTTTFGKTGILRKRNQEDDMQITRNSIATMAGPGAWFTGAVFVDTVATPSGQSRLSASSVHFAPARPHGVGTPPTARTIWVTRASACASVAAGRSRSSAR